MVSASIGTFPSLMQTTMAISDTGFGYNITRHSKVPLGRQRLLCSEYEIYPLADANRNLQQISPAALICIQYGGAGCKSFFMVLDYFSTKVIICTQLINRLVNSIRCIERQVELAKGKISLFESGPGRAYSRKIALERLESAEDEYSLSTTVAPTKKIYFHSDTMRHKVTFCEYVILTSKNKLESS